MKTAWHIFLLFIGVRKNQQEPIAVVPSSNDTDVQSITSDELAFPVQAVAPVSDAHFETQPYFTYVDRYGNVSDLGRMSEDEREMLIDMAGPNPLIVENLEQAIIKYANPICDMEAKSQAEIFADVIRQYHCLPDMTDPEVARAEGADGFGYRWNEQGYYKLSFVDFKDGSSWEAGKVC